MTEWNNYPGWKKYAHDLLGEDFFWDFKGMMKDKGPIINVYESGNEIICLIALPGLRKLSDVDLYVNYRTLSVQGRLNYKYNGFRLVQEELFEGSFNRKIELPFPVREKPIEATYDRGLLIVHLHRLIERNESKSKINIKELED